MRASVCQFLGTVLGLVTASAVGTAYGNFGAPVTGSRATDLLAIAFVALIAIGLPLFALVMLLLSAFTPQILRSPFLWCIAAPAVLTALGLWVFPVTAYHGLLWIAVIPLCATFAGILFYAWQRASPLAPVKLTRD